MKTARIAALLLLWSIAGVADVGAQDKLLQASQRGDANAVQNLLEEGAHPSVKDEFRNPPIIYAARLGFPEVVRVLLNKGVDVNTKGFCGGTPLLEAVTGPRESQRLPSLAMVRFLIQKGANVNAADDSGETAAVEAAQDDTVEILKALLDHGANVDAKDNNGDTALTHAAFSAAPKRWYCCSKGCTGGGQES